LHKLGLTEKRELVGISEDIPIVIQCEILNLRRSSFYYKPIPMNPEKVLYEEAVMARIDYWHMKWPSLGSRKLARIISNQDNIAVGRKLIRRLMGEMGIVSMAPKPFTSKANRRHKKYPYLLRNLPIFLPNQVWAIDITYIRMGRSHMYLTAIIDWYSRFIVGWRLSDTLASAPVLELVKAAIDRYGTPGIINSDQGSQFTSVEYVSLLNELGIRQSMDGKARWVDNVVIERWFRSLKCDEIYINEYHTPRELRDGIRNYVEFYNNTRPHESCGNATPEAFYGSAFQAA